MVIVFRLKPCEQFLAYPEATLILMEYNGSTAAFYNKPLLSWSKSLPASRPESTSSLRKTVPRCGAACFLMRADHSAATSAATEPAL